MQLNKDLNVGSCFFPPPMHFPCLTSHNCTAANKQRKSCGVIMSCAILYGWTTKKGNQGWWCYSTAIVLWWVTSEKQTHFLDATNDLSFKQGWNQCRYINTMVFGVHAHFLIWSDLVSARWEYTEGPHLVPLRLCSPNLATMRLIRPFSNQPKTSLRLRVLHSK